MADVECGGNEKQPGQDEIWEALKKILDETEDIMTLSVIGFDIQI